MSREMRTKKVIANEAGTLSDRVHMNVKTYFDLVETQDFIDGVPDLEYSYGDLRCGEEARPRLSTLALSRKPLILAGGGIQTTILMSGPNAFTVMSVIREIHVHQADIAA